MAYNFVTKEPTVIVPVSGEFVAGRFVSVASVEQNRECHIFQERRKL